MAKEITPIGYIYNDFTGKFGIPRQSSLAEDLVSVIEPEPAFSREEAFRGIEDFSHLWLLWGFSENDDKGWSLTVRPPKLGGNTYKGVFATRSPFRPNGLGLSCVKLLKVENAGGRVKLYVGGADLMNGTPIYDIKPYVAYADARIDARSGFAKDKDAVMLSVECACEWPKDMPEEKRNALIQVLSQDPRPAYQEDPDRIYGMSFASYNVRFTVKDKTLTIIEIM